MIFIEEGFIMKNLDKISCEVNIIHARQDFMCLVKVAYELNKKLKNSSLVITKGGHSKSDGNTEEELVKVLRSK